jgi:DNA-binding LytR/AlgR family response regulator
MNCLIVDDEILAQEVIEHYVLKTDGLVLAGKCSNAVEAFAALNRGSVDLMFLDIKMPEINGLDFIRTLKNPPKIILTTAFSEYALDGFELDVTDYLLKPVSFERFMKAVNKARQSTVDNSNLAPAALTSDFYVKSDRKLVKVDPSEILYIEAQKNYVMIHTLNQKIMTYNTLNNMDEELKAAPHLVRVHKSFMINKNYIVEFVNNIITLQNGSEIPLGLLYRDAFLEKVRII